jgi:drug/metabolite transporter (DMT)-like permease
LAGDLLVTSVFATSLAFLMQNALQKYSTPTRFAVVLTTEPVFAAIVAYLWAGESFTYRALAGAALIFGSMLISILTRKPKEPTVESDFVHHRDESHWLHYLL